MCLKRQMFSSTYLGYSIMRQYMIKLLNLDLFCDEEALVFDKSTVLELHCILHGKTFHPDNRVLFCMKFIYTRKYALIDPFVNWQPIYFFKFFICNTSFYFLVSSKIKCIYFEQLVNMFFKFLLRLGYQPLHT